MRFDRLQGVALALGLILGGIGGAMACRGTHRPEPAPPVPVEDGPVEPMYFGPPDEVRYSTWCLSPEMREGR